MPALDWHTLAHETITRRGRAARLELAPLADRYRDALRWRLDRLLPIVAAPAYAELWADKNAARRGVMFEAIFQSGDFHHGMSRRQARQVIARWLHDRLAALDAVIATGGIKLMRQAAAEHGALV